MTKLYGLLMMGLVVLFTAGCGDDGEDNEPKDTDNGPTDGDDSEVETDETDNGSDDTDAAGTDGDATDDDEVEALAACTDFLTTSWDHIRDCGSDIADILPPNTLAAGICTGFCETEDATVSNTDLDACLEKAESLPCEDIPADVNEVLTQLPEECAFLSDSLNCQFELPEA